MKRTIFILLLVLVGGFVYLIRDTDRPKQESTGKRVASEEKLSPAEDWQAAEPGYPWSFPRDLAAHPEYKIEWWYYTGNLTASNGRRFGYELTFFRTGIVKEPRSESAWALRDVYMAHFALSDIDNGRFRFQERINRSALDRAGAKANKYHVWNGDWSATGTDKVQHIQAAEEDFAIDLELTALKPLILHGENGFSRKGPHKDNASNYFSFTRLNSRGTLTVDGETFTVEGLSWMDHEFSSSFLEPDQLGWDWFALQLDNGWDVMVYRMRRTDGSIDPHSHGTAVSPEGQIVHLELSDYQLSSQSNWTSPHSGGNYPLDWKLTVQPLALELDVRATFEDQELRTPRSTGVTYWEGALQLTGTMQGQKVTGRGYQELTGYSGRASTRH